MRRWLYFSLAIFFGLLVAAWITHGRGVIKNDPARGIDIPSERMVPLQVKAAFDGKQIYIRYRWPTPKRNIEYDMLRFEGGKWVRDGQAKSQGDYEDRVSTMIDDGSVPEFGRYGAYVMANTRMWSTPDDGGEEEVAAHPYLGVKKGQREVGKYLPSTRQRSGDWASVLPEPELARLRSAGYFVDLWQWHINRTNPFGKADDGVVAEARYSDGGKGVLFATNWDAKTESPKLMFDPKKTGRKSLAWSDITSGKLAPGDIYLHDDQTVPFDPSLPWKDGDTIPRRVQRSGEGSAADVSVVGASTWSDGFREVILTRALNTGHTDDDKVLVDKGVYTVAFAVHRTTEGSRYHYVSLPVTLGLDRDAQLNARNFPAGSTPTWDQPWTDVTLFYPGRVAWATLTSSKHAGSKFIEKGVPVKFRHSESQLSQYGIEAVFSNEIWRQWIFTLFAGLALIAGFGVSLNLLMPRERNGEDFK
jgi:hypothetical protein